MPLDPLLSSATPRTLRGGLVTLHDLLLLLLHEEAAIEFYQLLNYLSVFKDGILSALVRTLLILCFFKML
jgi:hypothetical protein